MKYDTNLEQGVKKLSSWLSRREEFQFARPVTLKLLFGI